MIESLFCVLLFSTLADGDIPATYAEPTVAANVTEALAQLGLVDSIEVVQVNRSSIIAKPRQLPNGMVDHALWNSIKEDIRAAKETGEKGFWLHDRVFLSKLFGNGSHSYRQRTLPSLQVVFSFANDPNTPRVHKFHPEVPYYIRLDVDRFPPGSTKYNSGRHFVFEIFPHWLWGGCTNQKRIAARLNQNRLREEKAQLDKADSKKSIVVRGYR